MVSLKNSPITIWSASRHLSADRFNLIGGRLHLCAGKNSHAFARALRHSRVPWTREKAENFRERKQNAELPQCSTLIKCEILSKTESCKTFKTNLCKVKKYYLLEKTILFVSNKVDDILFLGDTECFRVERLRLTSS